MKGKFTQVFKIKELRNRIFFVLMLLVIFRFMASIPVPTVDTSGLQNFLQNNQFFGLLNLFSGGGMESFSLVALGVGPYITASIIFQLLTYVVPTLERMQKEEGEEGRRKINKLTRYVSVPLAAIQGYGIIAFMQRSGLNLFTDDSVWTLAITLVILTAGSVFLMWLGEIITEKGIGNGVSILIFAGIVAAVPRSLQQTIASYDSSKLVDLIIFALIALVVVAAIVFITEGQRNIPVSYARRVRGNKQTGGSQSHLPLRVNQAGVIPIIFAISVMLAPGLIANFFVGADNQTVAEVAQWIVDLFNNQLFYGIAYFVLVFAFTYFYTSVTFDPEQISENLQKNGGFIPGIRPGKATAEYLGKTLNRLTLTGAVFLGLVAVLPNIMQPFTNSQTLVIGGTGILITVSVVIEIVKQVEAQLVMRDYESFY
jgi:preprotein translocase subunit SecY